MNRPTRQLGETPGRPPGHEAGSGRRVSDRSSPVLMVNAVALSFPFPTIAARPSDFSLLHLARFRRAAGRTRWQSFWHHVSFGVLDAHCSSDLPAMNRLSDWCVDPSFTLALHSSSVVRPASSMADRQGCRIGGARGRERRRTTPLHPEPGRARRQHRRVLRGQLRGRRGRRAYPRSGNSVRSSVVRASASAPQVRAVFHINAGSSGSSSAGWSSGSSLGS